MSKHSASGRIGSAARTTRTKKPVSFLARRLGFESLEHRRLLSAVAAPTSIVFQPNPGQGTATLTSENNSSPAEELQFLVSGVTAGATVNVYDNGGATAIATGTVASGLTTITLTTDGNPTGTLADGSYTFTATQTVSSTASPSSPSASVQVFTALAATTTSATSATVNTAYSYTYTALTTNAPSGDAVTYALSSPPAPAGMTLTGQTVTWTPAAAQAGTTQSFALTATDALGNSATPPAVFAFQYNNVRRNRSAANWSNGLAVAMHWMCLPLRKASNGEQVSSSARGVITPSQGLVRTFQSRPARAFVSGMSCSISSRSLIGPSHTTDHVRCSRPVAIYPTDDHTRPSP